jgi:hypothetical protein
MKRLILISIITGLTVAPALAVPTIEFSKSPGGGWSYSDGVFTFSQPVSVVSGLDSASDTLVGALVYIPDLVVEGIGGGSYTLNPVTSLIEIRGTDGTLYLTGVLSVGDLVPAGTTAAGYTLFDTDITDVQVYNTIGSGALASIGTALDFQLTLTGGPAQGMAAMLELNLAGSDGFFGAMTAVDTPKLAMVPAPGAVLLGGIGVCLVGWFKSRKVF